MKFIISEIPDEGIELELTENIDCESLNILTPVRALIKLDRRGAEVIAKGVITANVEMQCSRCLENFTTHIKSRFSAVYYPAKEIDNEEHYELTGDELDTGFYEDDIFDTDELIKEQLLLNVPMKPLCADKCVGLCLKCGADLNEGRCDCEFSEIDPRLAVLKQLLQRKE